MLRTTRLQPSSGKMQFSSQHQTKFKDAPPLPDPADIADPEDIADQADIADPNEHTEQSVFQQSPSSNMDPADIDDQPPVMKASSPTRSQSPSLKSGGDSSEAWPQFLAEFLNSLFGGGDTSSGGKSPLSDFLQKLFSFMGNHNTGNDPQEDPSNDSTKYPSNDSPQDSSNDLDTQQKSHEGVNEDFRQGGVGNCATVSVIKAGLDKFGANGLLHSQKTGDGYDVKLRNGNTVHVSQSELDLAKQKSDFQPACSSKSVPDSAYLAYAVVAKGIQKDNGGSLSGAMDRINDGLSVEEPAQRLGLNVKEVSVQEAEKDGGIVMDSNHAMDARDGVIDLWGEVISDASASSRLGQAITRGVILT